MNVSRSCYIRKQNLSYIRNLRFKIMSSVVSVFWCSAPMTELSSLFSTDNHIRTSNDFSFPSINCFRRTLVLRPEFCLIIQRIRKSCQGFKRIGLESSYPHICSRIKSALGAGLCTTLTWEQFLPVANGTGKNFALTADNDFRVFPFNCFKVILIIRIC